MTGGGCSVIGREDVFLMSDEVEGEKGEKYFLWSNIFLMIRIKAPFCPYLFYNNVRSHFSRFL